MATENKVYIGSDNLVKLEDLTNAETGAKVDTATVTMSLFEGDILSFAAPKLAFTDGGTDTPAVGDVLTGNTSAATARIKSITLSSGTWAGGDAVGYFMLEKQEGTFVAETINITARDITDICNVAADSSGGKAVSAAAGADTQLHIPGHCLTTNDTIRILGTRNYDAEIAVKSVVDTDNITIDTAYVAENFNGTEEAYVAIRGALNISLTHGGGDPDGYYDGVLPDTAQKLISGEWYYLFLKVVDGAAIVLHRLKWTAEFYPYAI